MSYLEFIDLVLEYFFKIVLIPLSLIGLLFITAIFMLLIGRIAMLLWEVWMSKPAPVRQEQVVADKDIREYVAMMSERELLELMKHGIERLRLQRGGSVQDKEVLIGGDLERALRCLHVEQSLLCT